MLIRMKPRQVLDWMITRRMEDEARDLAIQKLAVSALSKVPASRILIVCPTRDRPEKFQTMCDSVFQTATLAHIVAWVDDDQQELYRECHREGVTLLIGKRVGPIAAVNHIVHLYRESEVYGMVPDDAVFQTVGWDAWLLAQIETMKKRVGVVAAAHNNSNFINFPWMTREWIDILGWYYFPENFHHCADTIIEILADATTCIYATPEQFYINHDASPTVNQDQWARDVKRFYSWCLDERRLLIKKIRDRVAV